MKVRLEHLPADVLGLSDIARAALSAGPEFPPLPVPRRTADILRPADRLDTTERATLARKIKTGLEPLRPPSRVVTSLNVLGTSDVFAVVTGQQPGFLASPLYSLYKGMQACRLAHELALDWGSPVVPVFWNHADDHDVAEVHHDYLLNESLDVKKITLAGLSSGRLPIGRIQLSDSRHHLGAIRSILTQGLGESESLESALDVFFPRSGETLARAFTRAMTALLGEHGLVVVEPDWIRGEISRALAELVSHDPLPPLAEGAAELRSLGFEPALEPSEAALVYHVTETGRHALRAGGDGYRFDGERGSRSPAELAAEIVAEPGAWSPGALFRPLVQDLVFPVAATIGGFGELAYHAGLDALRRARNVPRTPFVPRISCTLVEPETDAAMKVLATDTLEVLRHKGELAPGAAQPDAPPVIADIRATTEEALGALLAHRAELANIDAALGENMKRTARQIRGLIDKLLGKAERVHANKTGRGRRNARRVTNTLFPRGLPQERVFGPFAYTVRYGRAWIDALYEELPALSSEHLVVHLVPEGEEASA